jgi:hypothetical protein
MALYNSARQAFPSADVYVAATNDTSSRPFPFAVKEKLAKLAGVEAGHFVQVKSPFQAREITANYDPATTELIFVRSEKDATKPPQAGGMKKDGTPSYLQPLAGQQQLAPMTEHAYMAYLPTVEFGPGMTSATEIRTAWPTLNPKRKTALVMSLYPRTQTNPKLAANVVAMLDTAIGSQEVAESRPTFTPSFKKLVARIKQQPMAEVNAQNFMGGMTASYQAHDNQPVAEALTDANFMPAGEYKRYPIEIRRKPFIKTDTKEKFYIAQTKIGRDDLKAKGAKPEDAITTLKQKIDQMLNAAVKVNASATLDFNVAFAKQILQDPRAQFYAKIATLGGEPKLVIASPEMMDFGKELVQLGYKPSALRVDPESGEATPLPSIGYTARQIASTGLIANGRYVIGHMTKDDEGNMVFDLTYHSTVHTKSDKQRIPEPAMTVGTNRTVAEDYAAEKRS